MKRTKKNDAKYSIIKSYVLNNWPVDILKITFPTNLIGIKYVLDNLSEQEKIGLTNLDYSNLFN